MEDHTLIMDNPDDTSPEVQMQLGKIEGNLDTLELELVAESLDTRDGETVDEIDYQVEHEDQRLNLFVETGLKEVIKQLPDMIGVTNRKVEHEKYRITKRVVPTYKIVLQTDKIALIDIIFEV